MTLPARIGRYDVERLLGEGGMGRVLLGRDTVLGRRVALKILRDDLGLTPEHKAQLVERMRHEARAAAALSHPGMVTLHDMGEDDAVGLFLVFELLEGPTLRERLQRGPLPPRDVAALARTLGAALSHAHDAGVLHRDVKPENIMLTPLGAELTDFGIARLPDSTLTRGTAVLGTPAYSAPEVLGTGSFSPRSDQFSLAATLYEALTGERAFAGDDALTVATRVAMAKPTAPTQVLPMLAGFAQLDVILDRAMAKDPMARFASCETFCTHLAAELEGAGAIVTPLSRMSLVPRATRRWQNAAALVALGVIATLLVAGRTERPESRGASLREVANAFAAAAAGPTRTSAVTTTPVTHRFRPVPSASAGPGASATPAVDVVEDAGAAAVDP